MTREQCEEIVAILQDSFEDIRVSTSFVQVADYKTHTFVEQGQVSIWGKSQTCILVLTSMRQFDEFMDLTRSYVSG